MAENLAHTAGLPGDTAAEMTVTLLSPPGCELLDEIGHGGMGVVYRARDVALDRDVAVKLLSEHYPAGSLAAQRFLSEARITGQLQHPGIPAVHQVGTLADGRPFLAMKLIKGDTLEAILKQRSDPSAERGRLLAIFEAVCQAVGYAHAHRVIHRDLKPANVMVGAFGEVQVMDWGLAKVLGEETPATVDALAAQQTRAWSQVSPTPESGSHTQAGSLIGTPAFIPPEQAGGEIERVNERSDVFGLGALLTVILTGHPPYVGETFESVRVQALRGKLEDCFTRLDGCGAEPELVALCKKCLAFEPADRPADAGAVAAAVAGLRAAADERARQAELDRVQAEGETREALARAAEQRRRRRILLTASGIIDLVFLAGFAGVFWQWRVAETARDRADQSQKDTEKALNIVESEEEAGRKLQYTTDLQLAPFLWKDDRTTTEQLRVLLARHIPDSNAAAPKPDLRGFEWHYYQHLVEHSAAVFSGHAVSVVAGTLTSDGQLVTLDENGQVRRWELGSGVEEEASRRDLPGGARAQVRVLSPNGRLAALAEGNKVHVFDTSTGKETFQIDSTDDPLRHLIFSPDSARLVLVDGRIRWVSAVSGEVIAAVNQKVSGVPLARSCFSLALSADGLTLAVAGHGPRATQFSIFGLDETAKKVTLLAKDAGWNSSPAGSALSPDGQRLVLSHMFSGALFVVDTTTGRGIAGHMSAHASSISAITFSSDGAKLATGDSEGTIKIWQDAQKLSSKSAALVTLKGHQGAITAVRFSIDGKRLVTTSVDKTARVWDLENAGAAIRPLEGTKGWSHVARFSSDGHWIASANGNSVRLWDAATGRLARELPAGDNSSIFSVAFSPTDNRLLAVGYGGQADVSYVALWDIDAGTELVRLPGATDLPDIPATANSRVVGALAFSPDGKYLVAGFGARWSLNPGGPPHPLKVWEVANRRLILLNEHTGFCMSLDFSRDGKLLASGSRDGTAILWSTETWKALQTLQNPDKDSFYGGRGMVEGVAFSPDGKTLAMASQTGNVHLWDVASGKHLATLKGHSSAVFAVVFSPDGRTLASGSADHTIRLWNVETRRQLMQLDPGSIELGDMGVMTLAFSPDGKHLLAGGVGGSFFWSAAPIVWNDPVRAAEKLRVLLQSNADFQSRIRMLSEHARLYEALEKLDKLVPNDGRVQIALAVAQARRFAAQGDAALAYAARMKIRELLEEKLAKEPENSASAAELADVLLLLALADHRRGETDQTMKACRQAATMLKRAGGANAADRPLLHQTVLALGIESPEAKDLIAAAAGEPPATLNEAIRQKPEQAQGYRDRGNWYAERGRWKNAIADYAEVFRLDPNTLDGLHLASLLAYNGDTARYREHGQAMLKRWALTEKNGEADHTLQTVVLLPGYKADAKQLARLAEVAVAGDPRADWYEWYLHAKALHDLRTGRYADAVTASRASRQRAPQSIGNPELLTALDLVIEALALQGAGKADEARRTLEQAKPLVESYVPGIDGSEWWSDWLAAHMLYREAVGLIAAKKAEPSK